MQTTLLYNGGDGPAPYELNLKSPDPASKIVEVLLAMRSSEGLDGGKQIVDLVNETGWGRCSVTERGWTASLGTDTTDANDSGNGGVGNSARIDGTTGGHQAAIMLRRVKLTRTTKLDSLRGWERAFLRLRPSAVSRWELQLRAGPAVGDLPTGSNDAVPIEILSGATSFVYVEKDLGYVKVPEEGDLGGLGLEIWARRISGTGDLYLNLVRLLPATPGKDVLTRIIVPGVPSESWLGRDLVTPSQPGGLVAGTVQGTDLLLAGNNAAGGTLPLTGLAWPVGRHRVRFDVTYRAQAGGTTTSFTIRVRNITDNNNAFAQQISIPIDPNNSIEVRALLPQAGVEDIYGTKDLYGTKSGGGLEFDSVAGKSYQPQVVADALDTGEFVKIHSIIHEVVPFLAQNEQIVTDPESSPPVAEKQDAAGGRLAILPTEGSVPLWVPPGLAAVFVVPLEVRKSGHYPDAESLKARTVTLSSKSAPRYFA